MAGRAFCTGGQTAQSGPPWGRTVAAPTFVERGRSEIPLVSEANELRPDLEQGVSAPVATDPAILFSTHTRTTSEIRLGGATSEIPLAVPTSAIRTRGHDTETLLCPQRVWGRMARLRWGCINGSSRAAAEPRTESDPRRTRP